MKVDNSTNLNIDQKRNTIRITSKDSFTVGSLWIADIRHVPYGVSLSHPDDYTIFMLGPVLGMARLVVVCSQLALGRRDRYAFEL